MNEASAQAFADMFGEDPTNPDKLNDELRPYYEEEGGTLGWPMLRHPLVYQIPFMSWKNANDMYEHKLVQIEKAIEDGNPLRAIYYFERPYRLTQLEHWYWQGDIGLDKLKEALPELWLDTEHPRQFGYTRLVRLFKETGFLSDIPGLKAPIECEVFRGCLPRDKRGISWTLDKKRAYWFANRLSQKGRGRVYRTVAQPKMILGIFNERGEQEVLLNPRMLKNLEELPLEPM